MGKYFSSKQLYKDSQNGIISGVCAGLAKYSEQEAWLIRLLAVVGFVCLPVAAAIAYLMAVFLLRDR